ncbi:hybrid sensor histidine kinase/response regulator [Paractinoplanes rishiriensis]|uniref:histidine kinase n=1 Tax=Paractinoplanes rishiriensis TaxID=1050105 RepID=A0A919N076_9ACTN|nr:response regulator [Actinoplanes rishiriensis]GIE94747.1 hybrid sensor histidine kinase/response regulator [Actinoplanes rishiriensis]
MGEVRDPLRYFRIEARELVDQISAAVLDLDQQPGPELVARLLRFAHTLKGAARVVKQQEIAERAHEFEEVLVPHRGGADPVPADEMRELLRLNDEIARCVTALEKPAEAPAVRPAAEAAARPPETPIEDDTPAPRAATADLDELLDAIGEASARIAPLRDGSRTLARLHRGVEAISDRMRTRRDAGDPGTRAGMQRLAADLGALGRRLTDAVDQVERELDEIRGRAEGLRLVAAGTIFTALHRAVHDAAEAEGKRVRFGGQGGEIRMGPQLLNQISGAFLHVVRNAVVHGIESEADRLTAGKPAEGTVEVEVERRGRWAMFRCVDDGRGFDVAALRRVAEARGLLAAGQDATPDQIIDLVLRGGISTSGSVTDVAGRGIGMDVARDVAQQLHGTVSVRNRPGQGATVELSVPLTLLSMNGLIVEAGGTVVTMPLDAVRRCVRLPDRDAAAATANGRLAHDGEVVPFLPLARALYAGAAVPDVTGAGVAVVLSADDQTVAIGVDRLAGTTTLVARPLPDLAPAAPVIGSVAIDLDGNPRLVLDAHGLVTEALRDLSTAVTPPAAAAPKLPILVVDDSLTTRMLERSILESAGYEVDLAASGEEGLDRAAAREYGLFLTDIDMPGINGFEFVRRTRADPALAHVPAILVSSRATAEDRERGAQAGASAYVVKGEFNQEELLAHIRRLIL